MQITTNVQNAINRIVAGWEATERIVELPFLFSVLPEPLGGFKTRTLDIGSCESLLIMELDKLGFDSWGVDMRYYVEGYPKFIKCDARNLSMIPTSSFDVVIAISTIEHVGLVETPYGTDNVIDSDADIKVISEMLRVVRSGGGGNNGSGKVIITLPYGDGIDSLKKWIRFYNKQRVEKIVKKTGLVIDKITYFVGGFNHEHWTVCGEKECAASYSNYPANGFGPIDGIVCLVGRKE